MYHFHHLLFAFHSLSIYLRSLQIPADSSTLILGSGVSRVVYKNARVTLQKILTLRKITGPRELCIQFGCGRVEPHLRLTLATFKERYMQRLAPGERSTANVSDTLFLAATFFVVARKMRIKVDRERLLTFTGVASAELSRTIALVMDVVGDMIAPAAAAASKEKKEKKKGGVKRKQVSFAASENENDDEDKEQNQENADVGLEDDEDEEAGMFGSEEKVYEETVKNNNNNRKTNKKKQKKSVLTEKNLRQAVLGFTAASPATATSTADDKLSSRTTTRSRAKGLSSDMSITMTAIPSSSY